MGIVGLALRKPYTFIVAAILVLLLGISSIFRTPTDIFSNIDIPVVTVVWYYDGLSAPETEKRISTYTEFSHSFFVNNLRTIESQTTPGLVLQKLYFQPGVDIGVALGQTVVDIGTPVRAGQVLAIIRAPELDHRVEQAQATLAQARANLALAQITAHRSSGLVGGGAVSRQNFDVDRLTQNARQAEQKAADAVLAESAQRQAYTTVTAPYDGGLL